VITIEQPFGRPSATLVRCPTAQLLQVDRAITGSASAVDSKFLPRADANFEIGTLGAIE